MKLTTEEMLNKVDELGWGVEKESDNSYSLNICSPEGQDFCMSINADDFINEVRFYGESFDVSEETYLWLDNTGHGQNGAPYDMRDVYNDMEWCKKQILHLYNGLVDEQNKKTEKYGFSNKESL